MAGNQVVECSLAASLSPWSHLCWRGLKKAFNLRTFWWGFSHQTATVIPPGCDLVRDLRRTDPEREISEEIYMYLHVCLSGSDGQASGSSSTRVVLKLKMLFLSATCQTCSQQLCARGNIYWWTSCFSLFCLQIRIGSCVHLLLFITLGVHSSKFDVNPVTDDISRLSILVRTPLGRR